MKILFTSPLQDLSGFAHASRNFLLSLLNDDRLDVVARSLKYDSGTTSPIDPRITECLSKPLDGIEMCIQTTTANVEAVPVIGIVNGLYTFVEADIIPHTWSHAANQFDFIMVPCLANARALTSCGVTKPIMICPPPCNANDYLGESKYDIPNSDGRTIFYNICQLSQKKGIDALLRSYYAAFVDRPDEVLLVLKTYIRMNNRQNELEEVKQFVERIRQGCRLPVTKYAPVLPIVSILSDEDIAGLHRKGDAYVNASRGEGWCIPAFDALCHGSTLISNNHGGMQSYVTNENSLVYGGTTSLAFDMPHSDPLLYTGLETWFEPSTAEMRQLMRSFHLLKLGHDRGLLNKEQEEQWQSIIQRREMGMSLKAKFHFASTSSLIADQLLHVYSNWNNSGTIAFKVVE